MIGEGDPAHGNKDEQADPGSMGPAGATDCRSAFSQTREQAQRQPAQPEQPLVRVATALAARNDCPTPAGDPGPPRESEPLPQ